MMEMKMANVFLNAKMKLFCNGLGIVKFGGEMMVDMMSGGDENWWVGNGTMPHGRALLICVLYALRLGYEPAS